MPNTNKPVAVWMPCERLGGGEAFMLRSKDPHTKRFCSNRCAGLWNSLPYDRRYYHTPIYRSWSDMKTRCTNKNYKDWHNYGGRGIRICERWEMFANFLK